MNPKQLHDSLLSRFGFQGWWPLRGAYFQGQPKTGAELLEVCVGSILAQNTSWNNAEKALRNLRSEKTLSVQKLDSIPLPKLASLIRSSGYYNQKAKKLKSFAGHVQKRYSGRISRFLEKEKGALRSELLSIHGIGKETADSILLYAAQQPSFVVDAYTKRIAERLPLSAKTDYDSIQSYFEQNLPLDARLFNEFHALIVQFGKEFCRKEPRCAECFLGARCAIGKGLK